MNNVDRFAYQPGNFVHNKAFRKSEMAGPSGILCDQEVSRNSEMAGPSGMLSYH